jgi:hypothetical protein
LTQSVTALCPWFGNFAAFVDSYAFFPVMIEGSATEKTDVGNVLLPLPRKTLTMGRRLPTAAWDSLIAPGGPRVTHTARKGVSGSPIQAPESQPARAA